MRYGRRKASLTDFYDRRWCGEWPLTVLGNYARWFVLHWGCSFNTQLQTERTEAFGICLISLLGKWIWRKWCFVEENHSKQIQTEFTTTCGQRLPERRFRKVVISKENFLQERLLSGNFSPDTILKSFIDHYLEAGYKQKSCSFVHRFRTSGSFLMLCDLLFSKIGRTDQIVSLKRNALTSHPLCEDLFSCQNWFCMFYIV